ncbi:TrbM/KikA/MpfK family conjugal transfer protein [Burkholderia aenigmatica]|uniref:TrbM/KikA/MpfK family conjugal transfer protein n=1 Tax=Burkholderia aenigmatica TaxID=2015348 RepID=UPI0026558C9B|nr:TrbM/KikA/MpfK family conjugal transfer protein [Burkholderia aenigmatica]MDN7880120.1 TrbM/KikA/MpfK family conjugal transfer protein [Burkholderia aenigmatica]
MKSNNFFRRTALSVAFAAISANSFAQQSIVQSVVGEVLTGDAGLACSAIICLSSPQRPDACAASLARYFGISFKFWSDTVTGRINFLNMCPSASDTTKANMPALVDAIANGAGQCDAGALNKRIKMMPKKVCEKTNTNNGWFMYGQFPQYQTDNCTTVMVPVVDQNMPGYCVTYTNNVNTYNLGMTYVGDPLDGGHWVNAATGQ